MQKRAHNSYRCGLGKGTGKGDWVGRGGEKGDGWAGEMEEVLRGNWKDVGVGDV